MVVLASSIIKRFGAECQISVNPQKINQHAVTSFQITSGVYEYIENSHLPSVIKNRLSHHAFRFEPFVKSRFNKKITPIDEMPTYQKLKNFSSKASVHETNWFDFLYKRLSDNKVCFHKKTKITSVDEIIVFLESYRENVVESLKVNGYHSDEFIAEPTCIIGAEGEVYKATRGNHRFALARQLNMTSFPLTVAGVHRDYLKKLRISNISTIANIKVMIGSLNL